jgi:hypothetical protein
LSDKYYTLQIIRISISEENESSLTRKSSQNNGQLRKEAGFTLVLIEKTEKRQYVHQTNDEIKK